MVSAQQLQIAAVVLGYWTISISLVFANKYLVGSSNTADVSLFVAWIQCMVTVLTVVVMKCGRALLTGEWSGLDRLSLKPMWSRQILLMSCTFVSMLSFNNLCLRHVHLSFYQVARSLTLIFTVILSVFMLHKSVSFKILMCCLAVASGFFLGIDQESLMGTLSLTGVTFGVLSSLFVALNGIFTKKALDVVDGSSVHLTMFSNINAVVLFTPVIILSGQFTNMIRSNYLMDPYFMVFLLSTGVLSFFIAWISALQIHLTSPVTHHISSNTKAVLQTLLAVLYYHQTKQLLWWVSIMLVVGGALSYAIVRIHEEREEKKSHLPAQDKNIKEVHINGLEETGRPRRHSSTSS